MTPGGSLILLDERPRDALVCRYENVQGILDQHSVPLSSFQDTAHLDSLCLDVPQALVCFKSDEMCHSDGRQPVRSWNAPNTYAGALLPLATTGEFHSWRYNMGERYVTQTWIDPVALEADLQGDEPHAGPSFILRRSIRVSVLPASRSLDSQETVVLGSYGTNCIWVVPPEDAVPGELLWLRLPAATGPTSAEWVGDSSIVVTETAIGVVDALDLCEDMGIVALAPKCCGEGPRHIRFLYI